MNSWCMSSSVGVLESGFCYTINKGACGTLTHIQRNGTISLRVEKSMETNSNSKHMCRILVYVLVLVSIVIVGAGS